MPVIFGRNPVFEALQSGQAIDKVYILKDSHGEILGRIIQACRAQQIPVVQADRHKLDRMTPGEKNQGVIALISPVHYYAIEDLLDSIHKKGQLPALVMVDRIQDPHNMGAIIRSAEVLGMHGLIFSSRDSVPLTDVVVKASAGAAFYLPLCKVDNLATAARYLKKSGLWLHASSGYAEKSFWEIDFREPQAVIVGSEGKGVRPGILKLCDDVFRIPQAGKTESLNASVAAGIIFTEIYRQQHVPAG